jgi:hypothetical protein
VPFVNHGYKRTTAKKGKVSPVVAASRTIGEAAGKAGGVKFKRNGQTAKDLQAYPDPPPWWQGPVTEWVIFWDLTSNRHLVPQQDPQTGAYSQVYDFQYQGAASTSVEPRGFFRADFIFPPTSRAFLIDAAFTGGLILDPYSDFTHPVLGADLLKRAGLDTSQFPALTIFLEQNQLLADPHWLVGEALLGIDHSTRGAMK